MPESSLEANGRSTMNIIKRATQTGVVVAELLPTNEAIRYGALGLAMTKFGADPLVGAATLGGATLLVEGTAALATAELLTTDKSQKVISRINESVHKIIPEHVKMSPVTEAGVALYGGSVVVMAEKQRENPERTVAQNRRYGLLTASWMSGVLAVEGAVIAQGIDNITDPKTVGFALIAMGGLAAAIKWAKNQVKKDIVGYEARYDLSDQEIGELERDLIEEIKLRGVEEGVTATWVKPDSKYANLVRTVEAGYFPEVTEVTEEDEKNTMFMILVDTRSSVNRVIHATTVMKPNEVDPSCDNQPTGFYTVDRLVDLGNFSSEEFYNCYQGRDIDLSKSISIETNFRVGEQSKINGIGSAELAYIALLQHIEEGGGELGKSVVFATINDLQAESLKRLGIKSENLMGRDDLLTPEEHFGVHTKPVAIMVDDEVRRILNNLGDKIPQIALT